MYENLSRTFISENVSRTTCVTITNSENSICVHEDGAVRAVCDDAQIRVCHELSACEFVTN